MSLKLYNFPQSTCSQKVRLTLWEKEIEFDDRPVDSTKREHLSGWYLELNPNGVVPTLVHDGAVIIDSSVIIEYLDEVFPERSLTPANPVERAHMRKWLRYFEEVPTPAIRVPSYNLAFLRYFQAMSEEEFIALAESKPLRKEFLLNMGRTGFPEEDMNKAFDRLAHALRRMNDAIAAGGGRWLMGGRLTLADIAVMPVIVRMADIGLGHMWAAMPAIDHWLAAIGDHPAYRQAYYHGSLLTEIFPELKDELAG